MCALAPRLTSGSRESLPIDAVAAHPQLAALLSLWMRRRGGARWPVRLDPLEMPRRLLAYLVLVDVEPDPWALRVRLAGTRLCEAMGMELRGRVLNDLFESPAAEEVLRHTRRIVEAGVPHLATRSQVRAGGGCWHYTRLILPLARDGREVSQILLAVDPESLRDEPG